MRSHLWDRQERDFKGWEWPADQHGNQIEWHTPWLYLFGSTGSGKTTYARWWVQRWDGWEFTNVNLFIDTLRAASAERKSVVGFIEKLATYPRMVIDDLGSETSDYFNNFGTRYTPSEIFETVLYRRHPHLRTLLTTNLSPFRKSDQKRSSLERQYGPKIHSRLMEVATVYNMRGDRRKDEPVVVELRHKPAARSDVPLVPEADDLLYQVQKPMSEREWRHLIKKAPPKMKPYFMKWHALSKKEKEKSRGR